MRDPAWFRAEERAFHRQATIAWVLVLAIAAALAWSGVMLILAGVLALLRGVIG
jgi:uncharacterized membrane protein YdbT with pleckstrin-like domain